MSMFIVCTIITDCNFNYMWSACKKSKLTVIAMGTRAPSASKSMLPPTKRVALIATAFTDTDTRSDRLVEMEYVCVALSRSAKVKDWRRTPTSVFSDTTTEEFIVKVGL